MISKKRASKFDKETSLAASRPRERSFSLVETVIAVALISFLIIEMSGVNGNAINFADYSRKALQATYLAKRIMSQVEYQATIRSPLKEMAANEKDHAFEDAPDFQYNLSIEPIPGALDLMFKILSGGLAGDSKDSGEKKDQGDTAGMLQQIKSVIQQAVGEDPMWIAKVTVSWPEGARRSAVNLAMIITDVKKLESTLGLLVAKGGGSGSAPVSPPATGGGGSSTTGGPSVPTTGAATGGGTGR